MENPLIGKSFRWFGELNDRGTLGFMGIGRIKRDLCSNITFHFHSSDRASLSLNFDSNSFSRYAEKDNWSGDFDYFKFDLSSKKFVGFIDFGSDDKWEYYDRYWVFELLFDDNFNKIEEGKIFNRYASGYEDLSATGVGAFVDVGFAEKMERLKKEMESMKGSMGF